LSTATLAAGLDTNLPREVPLGHSGRDIGDRPYLVRQVCRELVDVVCEVLPDTGDLRRLSLAAELTLDPYLASHAGHLRREPVELIDHRIDRVLEARGTRP